MPMISGRKSKGGTLVLLSLLAVVFIIPVALVVLNSFKSRLYISSAPFALPDSETFVGFSNYISGLTTSGFLAAFGRSLFITVASVVAIVRCTAVTGWNVQIVQRVGNDLRYDCALSDGNVHHDLRGKHYQFR